MGCGPQVVKNKHSQSVSALQKKNTTDTGSSLHAKTSTPDLLAQ